GKYRDTVFRLVGRNCICGGHNHAGSYYIAFGAIGVLVSVLSFVFGRIDARAKRKQEERRTALYEDYLGKRSARAGASVDEADQYTRLPGGEGEV
ncbi:TPA: hypothetical protein ACUB7D_005413, partial [Serratia marcescens]